MEGLDYAERLKKLKKPMYSIQRRNERFKIIYIYKIKERLVPNISNRNGLTFNGSLPLAESPIRENHNYSKNTGRYLQDTPLIVSGDG